jgi:hypothetical protein
MITTPAPGPDAARNGYEARVTVPPPVAVTVTMASTSRPPSGRCSLWKAPTVNRGGDAFELPAMCPAPPRDSRTVLG